MIVFPAVANFCQSSFFATKSSLTKRAISAVAKFAKSQKTATHKLGSFLQLDKRFLPFYLFFDQILKEFRTPIGKI
jgi:hypothetical protein